MGIDADRFIRRLAPPPNVEFLGEIAEQQLLDLYATCRGLVAVSVDEDFGLTPVGAMSSGKAVIVVNDGGYKGTALDRPNGRPVAQGAASRDLPLRERA